MGAYRYHALNPVGKTVKGLIDGDSLRQVRTQLKSQQLKPLQVQAVEQKTAVFRLSLTGWQRALTTRELALFTRQLASLLMSSSPLDEALLAVARQSRKPHIKAIVLQVRSKVLEGLSLAQSLGQSARSFDPMYRALVRAGESSGCLGQVLEQLADYTEASQYSRQKLRLAMIYPCMLLLVSLTVVAILMTFVVPKLVAIFEHSHRALPWLTETLISTSRFSSQYGVWCLMGLALLVWAARQALLSPSRQRLWHAGQLKLPVFGQLLLQADCARFAATLSLLVDTGVTLVDALAIAAQVMKNRVLREGAEQLSVVVAEGVSLSTAMAQADFFPPLLVQMAASGEANGELAAQLQHAARNQERELELLLATLSGLMEPLTVIVMGVIVTTIVMAILLPIFDLNSLI